MKWRSYLIKFAVLCLALTLLACAKKEAADPPAKSAFAVSVNVSQIDGTSGELTVTLADGDTKMINTDGRYSFTTLLPNDMGFSIDISDPDDKSCTFVDTNDIHTTGIIDKDDMVYSITCTDVPNYSLGGTTAGITSTLVTLRTIVTRNNNTRSDVNVDVSANGDFTLATYLRELDDYSVTIVSQQGDETCSMSNGSGTAGVANISDIAITCTPNTVPVFNIGGRASNIEPNSQPGVTLKVDGGNDLILTDSDTNNGRFTFGMLVPNGMYTVTLEDPNSPTQICNFANGRKSTDVTIRDADDTTIAVNCVLQTFTISGSINGLASNSLIVTNSTNNEQASLVGNPATSYTFATDVRDGSYQLNIQDPSSPSQRCRFSNDRRNRTIIVAGDDVSTVTINCVTRQYDVLADVDMTTLTGTLGLELVVPNNPVVSLDISNSSVSPVSFGVSYDDLSTYTVNIVSQPVGETCTFPGDLLSDSDALSGFDATTRTISCTVLPTFTITGQVDGLIATDSISLQINNTTNDTAQASGDTPNYTFTNLLVGDYTVSITPQPIDYDCNFPGSAATATVTAGSPAPLISCRQKLSVALAAITDTSLNGCLNAEIAGPPVKAYIDEITALSCVDAGITDLIGIDTLFSLDTLDLSNNLLTDTTIQILSNLPLLTDLNLSNDVTLSNLNTITQVPSVVGLTRLNLNHNTPALPALDLTNLSTIGGLLDLSVDGNSLSDLTSFTGVTQITNLSISGNALADVSGLIEITELQTLLLLNNTVAMINLSILADVRLSNIYSIDLTGNAATPCADIEDLITALGAQGIVIPQSPTPGADCADALPVTNFFVSGQIISSDESALTESLDGLILQLNSGNDLPITGAATTFAFPTPLNLDDPYAVTVFAQPTNPVDIVCALASGGNGVITADVTDVVVDCIVD